MATSGTWRQTMGGYREQILDNCSFSSAPDAYISIILTREPLGNFKAVVTRTEKGGQRDALLSSESVETAQKAFDSLLIKSADAVQNYITTNGFELPPSPKKVGNAVDDDDDDDDGVSSVSSTSEVMDGDLDKDLGDSTLSFDAESAYESMTESEACAGGYGRPRGTHASRNSRWYPKYEPTFQHERRLNAPHYAPQHTSPVQRHRSSPGGTLDPKPGGPVARHLPPGSAPTQAAPGQPQSGAWRAGSRTAMAPPVVMGSLGHPVYSDHFPMGMRTHPSQMFSGQAPPPLPQNGRMVPPPPANAPSMQAQARHTANNASITGSNNAGQSTRSSPPVSSGHSCHTATTRSPPQPSPPQPFAASSPPPAHRAGPNKLPSPSPAAAAAPAPAPPAPAPAAPQLPAAIDYRLCIKSRVPGTGDLSEQRMVVRTPPTRAHVRTAALRYVEFNPQLFRHLASAASRASMLPTVPPAMLRAADAAGLPLPPIDKHLRANVTRVVFGTGGGGGGGGESYDLTTYGEDDLSRLCASVGGGGGSGGTGVLPLFEVVVTNVGPAGSLFTLS